MTVISALMAQEGRIRVRLKDSAGTPIIDAEVSVTGKDPKSTRTLKTDKRGEALFTGLPMGTETVRMKPVGFTSSLEQVNISDSKEVLVAKTLEVGLVGETVYVPEPEPIFDTPLPEKKYPTVPR